MREEDTAGGAAKLDDAERKGLADGGGLAVLLEDLAVESEAFSLSVKGDGCALVGDGGDGTLDGGADGILGLDLIPRVGKELLVTEAELAVGL